MSWKPSRNSGITFDKYANKHREYRILLDDYLQENNPPKIKDINMLSKYVYISWLNDQKANNLMTKKQIIKSTIYSEYYCPSFLFQIFNRNQTILYKPFLKLIQNV